MINVSNSVKTDCNSDNLKYKEYILVGGQTVEIRGKMSNSCYNEGNIFGTFIMKKLEFTTENDIEYKGKEVEYYKSVNGESFKIGTYIVTEIKDNDSDETVTVTALDYGLKSAIPYVTGLDYASGTVTLFDVLTEACSNAGLTLKNTSITNGDFIVDSNQFTDNELIGDVIKAVAHISGNFATINEDDKVELVYEEETDEIIEDYEELADKRDTLPITSVSIGTSQVSGQEAILRDEDMISEYGEHWLVLNDNPFAYTLEKRQELVTAVFNKVKGFSYSSFESKYSFKPYLQLGDKIQFRNKDGNLVDSRILKIDSDFDDITLSAPSIIKATIEYETPESALNIAKRTEIIVNKQTSEITSIAEELTDLTDYIVALTDTETLHLINTVESTGAINKLELTNFTQHALYPGMQYPSQYTFPGVLSFYTLVIDNVDTFDNEPLNVYINSPIPLQQLTVGEITIYDELIIEKGKARVIQRLGYEDDELVELVEPITHEIEDDILIPTVEIDTFIKVLYFDNLMFNCEYLMKNAFTNIFTTQIETSAIQTITNNNINMKVSKGEVISEINLSSEEAKINASKIKLEGYTTINDGFSVDLDGNMACNNAEMKNCQVSGGNISLVGGTESNPLFRIYDNNGDNYSYLTSRYFSLNSYNANINASATYFGSDIYQSTLYGHAGPVKGAIGYRNYFRLSTDGGTNNDRSSLNLESMDEYGSYSNVTIEAVAESYTRISLGGINPFITLDDNISEQLKISPSSSLFPGAVTIKGSNSLKLKARASSQCYMELYPNLTAPNIRYGWLGYNSDGTTTLSVASELRSFTSCWKKCKLRSE